MGFPFSVRSEQVLPGIRPVQRGRFARRSPWYGDYCPHEDDQYSREIDRYEQVTLDTDVSETLAVAAYQTHSEDTGHQKRAVSDEQNLVENTFEAERDGATVTLVPDHPGGITAISATETGPIKVQSGSTLAWEPLVADEDHIVAWTDGLSLSRRRGSGIKTGVLGGEGRMTTFSVEGRVWMQTRNPPLFGGASAGGDDAGGTSGGDTPGVSDFL